MNRGVIIGRGFGERSTSTSHDSAVSAIPRQRSMAAATKRSARQRTGVVGMTHIVS